MLLSAMTEKKRLHSRQLETTAPWLRRKPFEHRARVILKRVRVNPNPIVYMLAAPQMRLASGLVFKNHFLSVNRDPAAESSVQIGRTNKR